MYLDPGFGSMLIQALIASVAALAVGFGIFRHKIVGLFKKKGDNDEATEDTEVNQAEEDSDVE